MDIFKSGFSVALKWIKKGRLAILCTGFAITLLMLILYDQKPVFFTYLNNKFYDTLVLTVHSSETSGVPVIVDIDEKSLSEFGQFPWPRYRVAKLLEKINDLGATSVGIDIVFAEPDRTSLDVLQDELSEAFNVDMHIEGVPKDLMDNDVILANTLKQGPFVLGYYFDFEKRTLKSQDCDIDPVRIAFASAADMTRDQKALYVAPAIVCNEKVLDDAAQNAGFFNTIPDRDGVLRSTPLVIEWNDNKYANLALASYLRHIGDYEGLIKFAYDKIDGKTFATDMRINDTVIPLFNQAQMLIHWRGPKRTFPYYSASDILKNRLPKDELKGKIVFLGTSAAGLHDLRTQPFDQVYPGVEAHATVVDNIIKGDFFYKPPWGEELELSLVFALGVLSTMLLAWTSAVWSLIPLSVCSGGLFFLSYWALGTRGLYVSPLIPFLTIALNFTALTLMKFWREESERKFFHSAFSQYVSKAVVDQIVQSPDKLSLTGEEREVSILFSDIRSFTTISESLHPNHVSELLHEYFTPMTRKVMESKGTLDKFIGDAIMAFWNAPLDTPGHQAHAIRASLAMLKELERINPSFMDRFDLELKIGIGLHCGKVRVGNMGSADLFDYTIIGDNVNLASRLEGLTKFYGLALVVSETIKDGAGAEFYFQEVDKVRVKGKVLPITIYAPMTWEQREEREHEVVSFEHAMEMYKAQRFEEAEVLFGELVSTYDHKLYEEYLDRCKTLKHDPPADDWDHVFTHKSK